MGENFACHSLAITSKVSVLRLRQLSRPFWYRLGNAVCQQGLGLVSFLLPFRKLNIRAGAERYYFLFAVKAVFEISDFTARGGDQEKKAPKAFGFYHIMMNLDGQRKKEKA